MIDSPQHKSPAASLSPLSSRFAAEAERENIKRLKQECRGLSIALKSMKRDSKEFLAFKSKLDIATEELACLLEDRNLFRSFAGGDATELNVEHCLSFVPTPPLKIEDKAIDRNNSALLSCIPTPPLVTKLHSTAPGSAIPQPMVATGPILPVDSKERGEALNRTENKDVHQDAQNRNNSLHIAPKYSLEWFQNKMEVGAGSKQGKKPAHTAPLAASTPESNNVQASSWSPISLREKASLSGESRARLPRQCAPGEQLDVRDLSTMLETCPKYSLEWFTIKRNMSIAKKSYSTSSKNIHEKSTRIIRNVDNTSEQSRSLTSQDKQMHQHQPPCQDTSSPITISPKDSINRGQDNIEQKVGHLTDQLGQYTKYSLDWFRVKQDIEALKKQGHRGNDSKGGLNASQIAKSPDYKPSPKLKTKTESKMQSRHGSYRETIS